jgi:hypothetical protein
MAIRRHAPRRATNTHRSSSGTSPSPKIRTPSRSQHRRVGRGSADTEPSALQPARCLRPHDKVDVWMAFEVLPPTYAVPMVVPIVAPRCFGSAAMTRSASAAAEMIRHRHWLAVIGDCTDPSQQREDHVGPRQERGLVPSSQRAAADHWHCGRRLRPEFIGDARMGAILALLDMAAERSCAGRSRRSRCVRQRALQFERFLGGAI